MSEVEEQFENSDRGFKQGEPIPGDYGGSVRVYESSGALSAAIWIYVEESSGESADAYPNPQEATLLLNLDKARQLRDQLDYLIKNHYHFMI